MEYRPACNHPGRSFTSPLDVQRRDIGSADLKADDEVPPAT